MSDRATGGGHASRRGLLAAAGHHRRHHARRSGRRLRTMVRLLALRRRDVRRQRLPVGQRRAQRALRDRGRGSARRRRRAPRRGRAGPRGARRGATTPPPRCSRWGLVVLVPLGARRRARRRADRARACSGRRVLPGRGRARHRPAAGLRGPDPALRRRRSYSAGVLQAHHRFVAAALAPLHVEPRRHRDLPRLRARSPPTPRRRSRGADVARRRARRRHDPRGRGPRRCPSSSPCAAPASGLAPDDRASPHGVASRVRRLAVAGLLAVAGQQLATLVFIRLANDRGGPGTLNVYTYVQAVSLLPYAVLAVPLATAAFPTLAGHAPAGRTCTAGAGNRGRDRAGPLRRARAHRRPAAVDVLRRTWLATLLVRSRWPRDCSSPSPDRSAPSSRCSTPGERAGTGAEALSAIPDALALVAPGIVGLCAIGLLTRASYVRGPRAGRRRRRRRGAGSRRPSCPSSSLDARRRRPATTVRALALGTSVGLVPGAVAARACSSGGAGAARRWPCRRARWRPASPVRRRPAVLGWWLGGLWSRRWAPRRRRQCVVVALAATAALVGVDAARRPVGVTRLRRRPASSTAARRAPLTGVRRPAAGHGSETR